MCARLEAQDRIFAELSDDAAGVPSPVWHQEELSSRLKRVERGDSRFWDFDEVKTRIRSQLP